MTTSSRPATGQPRDHGHLHAIGFPVADLARTALLAQLGLRHKPALTDPHREPLPGGPDATAIRSGIEAFAARLVCFAAGGMRTAHLEPAIVVADAYGVGQECAKDISAATGRKDVHQGIVFSLGLTTGVVGRLLALGKVPTPEAICQEAAVIANCVFFDDEAFDVPESAGLLYRSLNTLRAEAIAGFPTIRQYALPAVHRVRSAGGTDEQAWYEALLELLAHNRDDSLLIDGDPTAMIAVRVGARVLLDGGGALAPEFPARLRQFDSDLTDRLWRCYNSAILLVVTIFLDLVGDRAVDLLREFRRNTGEEVRWSDGTALRGLSGLDVWAGTSSMDLRA